MTYSIVARDARTGEIGVAVQSHYFSVGSIVPWAHAGVGAVATQSIAEISYGPLGLELLRARRSPAEALAALTAGDPGEAVRQVAAVDAQGRVAAHTGARCIAEAGHRLGDGYSVQANMMRHASVPDAMAQAFEASAKEQADLAGRLLAALDAAEAEGGDVRGRQSAAILVVEPELHPAPWRGVLVDVRVDDHTEPLTELRRLVALRRAYSAEDERGLPDAGIGGSPDNPELAFWAGVSLAAAGDLDGARTLLGQALSAHDGWTLLLRRLPAAGLLPDDPELLQHLLSP